MAMQLKSNIGKWDKYYRDGYSYNHQRFVNNIHYYGCSKYYFTSKCAARLKIIGDEAFPNATPHNHGPEVRDVGRATVLDSLKKIAKESKNDARQLIADA